MVSREIHIGLFISSRLCMSDYLIKEEFISEPHAKFVLDATPTMGPTKTQTGGVLEESVF